MAIIGFFLCPILEIVAFVYSIQAFNETRHLEGDGRVKATIALGISGTWVLLVTLFLINAGGKS